MSVITGRGDEGTTDLMFGKRIAKTSLRVEVLGTIDELNAALGLARAAGPSADILELIDRVQEKLVGLMGELACLPEDDARYRENGYPVITLSDVEDLTATARGYEAKGVRFSGWARPGAEGSLVRAGLDFARTAARRAERAALALHESGAAVPREIRLFFNRLSDLLWILARLA
jgi:cob(I)alamin adenosyltransferase